jgi:hypothetical protein
MHDVAPEPVHLRISAVRDRAGAALLVVCALGAVAAAVAAVPAVVDAGAATQGVEAWRMIGYLFFAGVFVLLALAPRQLRGLWELTIAAKLALPVAALTVAGGADDADTFLVADGIVSAVLIGAYVLVAGWRAVPPGAAAADGA